MLDISHHGNSQNCSGNYFEHMEDWASKCLGKSTRSRKEFYECLKTNQEITRTAEKCIWSGDNMFDDPSKYEIIGYVSLVHCISPIILGLIIFFSLQTKSVWTIPFPVVTKLRRFIVELKYYNERTSTHFLRDIVTHENNLKDSINIDNLSLINEASSESTFQIWIQTVKLMPFIILNVSNSLKPEYGVRPQIDEILNMRGFSILTSFISIAMSFYNIR